MSSLPLQSKIIELPSYFAEDFYKSNGLNADELMEQLRKENKKDEEEKRRRENIDLSMLFTGKLGPYPYDI